MADRARARAPRWWLALGMLAAFSAVAPATDLAHLPPIARPPAGWGGLGRAAVRGDLIRDLAAWWALFTVAAAALSRAPRRAAVGVALAAGAALAVASLSPVPVLSDDLYRYAWDARVQEAGIDPYRFAPEDLRLSQLRDAWLWPDPVQCQAIGRPPGCTRLNRAGVHTVYPPGAQLWFRFAGAIVPRDAEALGYELLGLAVVAVSTALLLVVLRRTGRDARRVAWWTLCPAVPLEAVQNAHVDALTALLLLGAVALAARRQLLAAVAVAAAALTKLYPLLLLPALVQRRRILGSVLAGTVVVLAYLPYVLDVGSGAGGYLLGYLGEGGYGSGARFFLLRLVGISGPSATYVAVLGVATVVVLAVLRRLGPPDRSATTVLVVLLLATTPGEPWLDLALVVLVPLTGAWQWLGVVVAEYVDYLSEMMGGPHVPATTAAYGAALALGVTVSISRVRRPVRAPVP